MLKIASQAAESALNVEEAMSNILPLDAPAIPIGVMNALVTCIAKTSKGNRRCRRPKVNGSDFCVVHNDTTFSSNRLQTNTLTRTSPKRKFFLENNEEAHGVQKKKKARFKSIAAMKADVQNFFREVCQPYVKNLLKWNIQSVEDAFCSERNAPFPLGLHVRRYFPGYGTLMWKFNYSESFN